MNEIKRQDKIKSIIQLMKVPTLILLGLLALYATLCFFFSPIWPILALMAASILVCLAMAAHYYFNGPWFYITPVGIKVWWDKGVEPYHENYVDSRILLIIKEFCAKSGIKNIDRDELLRYICNVQIYVMAGNIHALGKVIGATQPGISTKFKYEYFDLALDHEIKLHLCHYFFPNRSEDGDVAWMVLKGIE